MTVTLEKHVTSLDKAAKKRRHTGIVKWAGGKKQLLFELLKYIPKTFGAYHEPFLGGGALFFALAEASRITEASLGDMNAKLVTTYQAVRDEVETVIAHLQKHKNNEHHYYEVREHNMQRGGKVQRAADFIFLNRAGFNGLYRENKKGRFNVPFGDNPKAQICDEASLRSSSRLLQLASVTAGDFARLRSRVKKGDLVYFDPPYLPLSKTSNFTGYTADGFGLEDQKRLRQLVQDLVASEIHVLLSSSSATATRELYDGFSIIEVNARRSVNSKGDSRGAVKELLIMSPWLVRQQEMFPLAERE